MDTFWVAVGSIAAVFAAIAALAPFLKPFLKRLTEAAKEALARVVAKIRNVVAKIRNREIPRLVRRSLFFVALGTMFYGASVLVDAIAGGFTRTITVVYYSGLDRKEVRETVPDNPWHLFEVRELLRFCSLASLTVPLFLFSWSLIPTLPRWTSVVWEWLKNVFTPSLSRRASAVWHWFWD